MSEEFGQLSHGELLSHSSWKARQWAWQHWNWDQSDRLSLDWLRSESNLIVQEQMMQSLLDHPPLLALLSVQDTGAVASVLLDTKYINSSRPGVRSKCQQVLLVWIQESEEGEKVLNQVVQLLSGYLLGTGGEMDKSLPTITPKYALYALGCLRELVVAYGCHYQSGTHGAKKMNGLIQVRPIVSTLLPRFFQHADVAVRKECALICKEIYGWLGGGAAAMTLLEQSLFSQLKPVQVKDLKESLEALPASVPKQTRFTKRQREQMAQNTDVQPMKGVVESVAALSMGNEEPVEMDGVQTTTAPSAPVMETVDPFELADPRVVLSKLPADFYDTIKTTSKWKDRKEALDALLALLSCPRLATEDASGYSSLTAALAQLIQNDSNVQCVVVAAQCVVAMAKGLRSVYGSVGRDLVVSALLERMKERKVTVVTALKQAVDALFYWCTGSWSDCFGVSTWSPAVVNKNPQIRVEATAWLARSLLAFRQHGSAPMPSSLPGLLTGFVSSVAGEPGWQKKKAPGKEDVKVMMTALRKAMDDSTTDVREAAMAAIGVLWSCVGERAVILFLENGEASKVGKIREVVAVLGEGGVGVVSEPPSQETVGSSLGKSMASASASSESISTSSKPAMKKPALGKKSMSAPSLAPKKTPAGSLSKSKLGSSSMAMSTSSSSASLTEIQVRHSVTEDEAVERVVDFVPAELVSKLNDGAWKVRLETMDALLAALQEKFPVESCEGEDAAKNAGLDSEVLLKALKKHTVWRDNNVQVTLRLFQVFLFCARRAPNFPAVCVELGTAMLVDKLGDLKLKAVAAETLGYFAERTTLQFVFNLSYPAVKAQKSPKIVAECLKTMKELITAFGVRGIQLKALIAFSKEMITNSNPGVRNAAVQLLVGVRVFVGPDLRALLGDIPDSQLALIDAEFERVSSESASVVRNQAGLASEAPKTVGKSSGASASKAVVVDAIDDLIPRVDIGSLVDNALLQNMNNANWKLRKEGLDTLQQLIASNPRLKGHLSDLVGALKARLGDSNKNLAVQTLDICAALSKAYGPGLDKYTKTLVPAILANLNDNKATVRQTALNCLDAFCEIASWQVLLQVFGVSLLADLPNLRKDLLVWLCSKIPVIAEESKVDFAPLIAPVLGTLLDRSQDIRKAAQSTVQALVVSIGFETVRERCNDFKGAQASGVISVVDGMKGLGPTTISNSAPAVKTDSPTKLKKAATVANLASNKESGSSGPTLTRSSSKLSLKKRPVAKSTSSLTREIAPETNENASPFTVIDLKLKDKRADQDRGIHKWSFDAPRKDLIDFLRDQMEQTISPALIKLLFSEDHHKDKDYVNALTQLDEMLVRSSELASQFGITVDELQEGFVANSDLLFKYLSVRLFDSNTVILLKILDFLDHYIALLDELGYHLMEYEASAFLPHFINKVGDNKETVRTRIHGIMRLICRIYPASKFFNHLVNALQSKNARTRAECLEELGFIIQRNGVSVISQKNLPQIAAQISDRDSSVRTAALNTIVQAYVVLGDKVFSCIGKISEKDRSLLDERIKRSNVAPVQSVPVAAPSAPPAKLRTSRPEISEPHPSETQPNVPQFSLDLEQLNLPKLSGATEISSIPSVHVSPAVRPQPRMHSEIAMDYVLTQITSGDVFQSIDALKQLEKYISTKPDVVAQSMNPLVNAVTLQVRLAFTSPIMAGTEAATLLRLCKHLVNALVQMFSNKQLALQLSRDTMHQLLSELLARLIDQSLQQQFGENGSQLTRALNVLMIRILENCNKNHVFSVLLDLLDSSVASLQSISDNDQGLQAKYAELVMKCLWKITKSLQDILRNGDIDVTELLFDIHKFLTATPPSEWKLRAAEKLPLGDMPLRTAKTIVHELVTGLSASSLDYMMKLPVENPKKSAVYSYMVHMLEATGALKANPDSMSGQPHDSVTANYENVRPVTSSESNSRVVPMATPLTDEEITLAIDQIFMKISSKDATKEGLQELYTFQRQHPHAQDKIETKLGAYGVNFRIYIRRSLQRIGEERGDIPSTSALLDGDFNSNSNNAREETEEYKERLMRLQQRLGYSAPTASSDPMNVDTFSPQKVAAPAPPSFSATANPEPNAEESSGNTLPSVLALKERLAKMKSSMSSFNSANS